MHWCTEHESIYLRNFLKKLVYCVVSIPASLCLAAMSTTQTTHYSLVATPELLRLYALLLKLGSHLLQGGVSAAMMMLAAVN